MSVIEEEEAATRRMEGGRLESGVPKGSVIMGVDGREWEVWAEGRGVGLG